jgi:hypothetical protein
VWNCFFSNKEDNHKTANNYIHRILFKVKLFGVAWVMPQSVNEMLGSWRGKMGNRLLVPIWRMAPLYLIWCLWKKRNAHSFEDCETSSLNLKKLATQTLFTWRVTLHSMSDYSFSDF